MNDLMMDENHDKNESLSNKSQLEMYSTKILFEKYPQAPSKIQPLIRAVLKERGYSRDELDELLGQ